MAASKSSRLMKHARQLVDQLMADIAAVRADLDETRAWNRKREPFDVDRYIGEAQRDLDALERRIKDQLEPMLERRANNAPSVEDQLADQQRQIDDLRDAVASLSAQLAGPQSAPAPDLRIVQRS